MFFQSIHQMIAAGTDLSINIRRVNDNLFVAVMPRRTNLKSEAQQLIVPLIFNGTPEEWMLNSCGPYPYRYRRRKVF